MWGYTPVRTTGVLVIFSFYLLVKLFTLPELIALMNKELQYLLQKYANVQKL